MDSGVEYTNDSYGIHIWDLSEPIELNTVYTITLWGKLGEGKTDFVVYPGNKGQDGFTNGTLRKIKDDVYSALLIKPVKSSEETDLCKLEIFVTSNTAIKESTVSKIKLEKGENHDPIWTPNPQDIISLYKRVSELESKINLKSS